MLTSYRGAQTQTGALRLLEKEKVRVNYRDLLKGVFHQRPPDSDTKKGALIQGPRVCSFPFLWIQEINQGLIFAR